MKTLLLALGLLLVPSFSARADGPAAVAKAPAPLEKIAVLGASVSAGMGLDPDADPFAGAESKVRLANVIEASIVGAHQPPVDESTLMFFTAPEPTAKRTVKDALAAKPTMVVALDYLFWFGYGLGDDAKRLARLEAGLKTLETFKCPLLLGDFADFNGANVHPMMLSPKAIPSAATLEKLNERLAAWAKERANVVVVPVKDVFAKLRADELVEVLGNRFEKGATKKLMQADGLHTTIEGTAALWVVAVDAWLATKPAGVDPTAFELDVAKLAAKAPAVTLTGPGGKAKPEKPAKKPKEKAGAGG